MDQDTTLNRARKRLKSHGQDHLLAFWADLSDGERHGLLRQIGALDLDQVDHWVARYVKGAESAAVPASFEPVPCYRDGKGRVHDPKYLEAKKLGEKLIAEGRVGAFVVAGGQGTRLGFYGPKGSFPATPVKNKPLFQVFAETILACSRRYGAVLPWYIMTSPLNHAQTVETFRAQDYYGLDPAQVFLFQQGTLPNFDFSGRILLADKDRIACSPDGHGGSLRALHASGALADMAKRGVDYVTYWQVDNPMINIFDPLFIGLHAMDRSEMSSKALQKTGPMEKLGNFCLVDGKVTVIEYSDLPGELANRRNPDGSLVFEMGSIGIHVISREFVERLNAHGFALPLHKAVKRIPCVDASGQPCSPAEPNGVKLESFVFDAIPLAARAVVLETRREEEFAPIKNATGVDSAQSSREMMIERATRWLEASGIRVPRTPQGRPDCTIEIAPRFALCAEDVQANLHRVPALNPKGQYYLD